jgi:hypothetical protein
MRDDAGGCVGGLAVSPAARIVSTKPLRGHHGTGQVPEPTPARRLVEEDVWPECAEPGASKASVALKHGPDANLVHKWRPLAPSDESEATPPSCLHTSSSRSPCPSLW